ncbi:MULTISPECIES: hypothetical protein [unclassified Paracoccus (in: a-proteobacteria)]|uniref:hypothetical protein n=1 Tax=unclassified Paracoccus (in: a-proteobacteria) TaxID=2688777 RepID=UPI0012B3F563|nr:MULTISPECIES: hypothetical protein [unclassified Paracoccus (in: a-proteobacteria)]UXU76513.1 hypothetical protein GB879_014145 [Paracoccus sp. SMMA_5]UXU82420.1 hypothetical protein GB880_014290 [Paracoccus sp. SMMA_5_TC]
MLILSSARMPPDRDDLVIFDDDGDLGLHHVLPLRLRVAEGATLTVMGRGARHEPRAILGGFFNLPLTACPPPMQRRQIIAAWLGSDPDQLRLSPVVAALDLSVTLSADAGVVVRHDAPNWQGSDIVLSGEVPVGEAGAALARDWDAGLPHLQATMRLRVQGISSAVESGFSDQRLRLILAPGQIRHESRQESIHSRRRVTGELALAPLRPVRAADGDGGIGLPPSLWAGFSAP